MQCGLFLTAIGTFFIHGVLLSETAVSRTPGYLDFDNLPETNFTCEGKVIGGYYADIETGCQMFHVCTIGQRGDMTDIKFLCLNGTVFDQETRVCERVDEVDCSRSQDFYDLNLELYHGGGGILPEDESKPDDKKKETESSEEVEEEIYDDSYELDTEEPPPTTTKTTTTTSTTTTTTTTTTQTPPPLPIYTSPKPSFNIVLPNLKNKNTGTHLTGFVPNYNTQKNFVSTVKPPPTSPTPGPNENRNVGTHLTGFVSGPSQSPRPFGLPHHQQYGFDSSQTYPKPLDTGLKPPPSNYQSYPVQSSTSYKPPGYDFNNYFYPSSSPTPPMLVEDYGHKTQNKDTAKRPLVVISHHFPALPTKTSYDEFSAFTSPGTTFLRYKSNRPSQHKPNPTILALQSQQKKVHQLHQEGLEHAEHQNAQIASRNAEISNLQSQRDDTARSYEVENGGSRETKEIHAGNSPAIAVVTSTSSTSSRVQKQPITSFVKTVTDEKGIPVSQQVYSATPEFQSELEKLFKNSPKKEESADMDLEQLLLAWKLKTNQEVTKSDIEKVFLSLDLSKFKNGETISLTDIFKLMNDTESDKTTRVPPTTYDEYTEEDVPFDPFFKDVPKVGGARSKRDSNVYLIQNTGNGQFSSHESRRRAKGTITNPVRIADIELLTGSKVGHVGVRKTVENPSKSDRSEPILETTAMDDVMPTASHDSRQRGRSRVTNPVEIANIEQLTGSKMGHVSVRKTGESTVKSDGSEPIPETAATDELIPTTRSGKTAGHDDRQRGRSQVTNPVEIANIEKLTGSKMGHVSLRKTGESPAKSENSEPISDTTARDELILTTEKGKTVSHDSRRRGRSRVTSPVGIADIEQLTGSKMGHVSLRNTGESTAKSVRSEPVLETRARYEPIPTTGRGQIASNDGRRRGRSRVVNPLVVNTEKSERLEQSRESAAVDEVEAPKKRIVVVQRRRGDKKTVNNTSRTTTAETEINAPEVTTTTPRPYPETSFSCRDKITGGFYADVDAHCEFFHICSDAGDGSLRDNKFFCGHATKFNQRSRTCQAEELVDCSLSLRYYNLNENFRIPVEEPVPTVPPFEPAKLQRKSG